MTTKRDTAPGGARERRKQTVRLWVLASSLTALAASWFGVTRADQAMQDASQAAALDVQTAAALEVANAAPAAGAAAAGAPALQAAPPAPAAPRTVIVRRSRAS